MQNSEKYNILYTRKNNVRGNLKVNFIFKIITLLALVHIFIKYDEIILAIYLPLYAIFFLCKCLEYQNISMDLDLEYANALEDKNLEVAMILLDFKPENIPKYSILVPMHKENIHTIRNLKTNLDNILYPREKLEILILLEECDLKTIEICKQLELNLGIYQIIIVPNDHLKTKGRALNFGLMRASGKYLAIYDAEDCPHKMQIMLSLKKFTNDPNLRAIQCNLRYYNRVNSLSELFFTEYEYIFTIRNVATVRLFNFVMLGGTSNHFITKDLQEIQGWDAFNVTEDFEISLIYMRKSWNMGTLNVPTLEEAVTRPLPWIRQRSRWIKGYMQTFSCYLFNGKSLLKRPFVNLFFLAYCSTMLLFPLYFMVNIAAILTHSTFNFHINTTDVIDTLMLALILLPVALEGALYQAIYRTKHPNSLNLFRNLLARAIYMILFILAYIKALYEFIFCPYYWDKTEHLGTFNIPKDQ